MESLQTMECLTEFPTLEERWDFRHFPPIYGDPHYQPSQLKNMMMEDQDKDPEMKEPLFLGHPQIENPDVMFWEEEDL